jgi:hypothetical protein
VEQEEEEKKKKNAGERGTKENMYIQIKISYYYLSLSLENISAKFTSG